MTSAAQARQTQGVALEPAMDPHDKILHDKILIVDFGSQVNQLIEARKQMAKMMKAMGSGKMPALPGASGTMPGPPSGKPRPSATRKSGSKRKKRAKR